MLSITFKAISSASLYIISTSVIFNSSCIVLPKVKPLGCGILNFILSTLFSTKETTVLLYALAWSSTVFKPSFFTYIK